MKDCARTKEQTDLYLLAIGACLADDKYRALFFESLGQHSSSLGQINELLQPLSEGDAQGVWRWFTAYYKLEADGESRVIDKILYALQKQTELRRLRKDASEITAACDIGNTKEAFAAAQRISERCK